MNKQSKLPPGDLERLSAYLDGQLSAGDTAKLESRLEKDGALRHALSELESVVGAIKSLEPVRPPRSFALSAADAGARALSRSYPWLQLATAVSSLAFVALVGVDLMGVGRLSGQFAAAPASEQAVSEAEPVEPAEVMPENEGAAALVAGEETADLALPEAAAPQPEAVVEAGEPIEAEGEIAEGAMKFAATSMPTTAADMRAMAPEPSATAVVEPALGAASEEPMQTGTPPTATASDAVYLEDQGPTVSSAALRLGEIASGALALFFGVMLLIRRRQLV